MNHKSINFNKSLVCQIRHGRHLLSSGQKTNYDAVCFNYFVEK